ncbi:protein TBF1, partial [Lecanoromycetidae sp. Uapishka_2]
MPTRRQQAAAANELIPKWTVTDEALVQPDDSMPTASTLISNTPGKYKMETIGSRLRKRRRTDSLPTEDSPPAPKRASPRKSTAVGKRTQANRSSSNAGSLQEPTSFSINRRRDEHIEDETRQLKDDEQEHNSNHPPGDQERAAEGLGAVDFGGVVDRGETEDLRHASRGNEVVDMVDTEAFSQMGAGLHLRIQSLPILDNLATQILNTLAKSTYREIITIATTPESDPGQAYSTLKSLFDHTRKIYSIREPFLNPYELGMIESAQLETIKKANMATFVSSVFGSQDVGFYHLNENFLDTFIADGNRLLKNQAQLYLDLKTQAYISAAASGDRAREEILEDLFPRDLEERLLKRRPGAKQLAPSEAEFVQRARNRRKALLDEPATEAAVKALPEKYVWEDFLRDVSTYVTKHFEAITGIPKQQPQASSRGQHRSTHSQMPQEASQMPHSQTEPQAQQISPSIDVSDSHAGISTSATNDIAGKAAQAANYAMQDIINNATTALSQQSPSRRQGKASRPSHIQRQAQHNMPEIRYHFEHALHPNVPAPPPPQYFQHIPYLPQQMQHQWQGQLHQSYSDQNVIPYPTQTAPTQVLYERAREAATAKAGPTNRRSGTPSQRRPWTTDEENSLMAGLDRVKGPHWSQILAMFGPGGTINEVLKDRNQVQLKDKARNLKLFFLKSGIEVPYYLQFVTGELKTRAPAQAAKNEARERANSDEDRAHIEAVNTLAAGHNQGADPDAIDFEGNSFQNGNVPTANMGSGVQLHGGGTVNSIIDPATGSNANVTDNIYSIADAPTDGVGEILMSTAEGAEQRRQMSHGMGQNGYMQLQSAGGNMHLGPPNVDPSLSA